MATRIVDLLRRIDIFERLPEPQLVKIGRLLRERKFSEDQVLFAQGAPGQALYLVTQGRVKIFITDQFGREKVLAFLGEGEFFGEMAVLTGAARSATAQATSEVKVLELRKDDFDVLLAGNVDVLKEMLRVANLRQTVTTRRVSQEAGAEVGTPRGLLTVVFSPRGGAGKSTLAANLAVALAQETPDRVVLVDLDLLFGHQSILLNVMPRSSLAAITPAALGALDRESFGYYLTTHEESSLRLLVGALRPEEGEVVSGEHVRTVLGLLRRQFVHVVVDVSSNFADPSLVAVELADRVLVVSTPDPFCARDVRECQRIFVELLSFPAERFKVVLNHLTPYDGLSRQQAEQAFPGEIVAELPFGGDGPSRAALEGAPLVTRLPHHPTARAILALAASLRRVAEEALALAGR